MTESTERIVSESVEQKDPLARRIGSIGPRPSYDDNKWITSRNVTFEKIPKTSHRLN